MVRVVYLVSLLVLIASAGISQDVQQDDEKAVIETALNYGDGFYSGNGERMQKALSPDLVKLAPMKLPNYDKTVLMQSTFSGLVEMSRAKLGFVEEDKRNISVDVLLINGDVALAKLKSSQFNDYLQMIKVDNEWKIVNVLWTHGPDSRSRAMVPELDPEEQKPLLDATVRSFYEGLLSGDADKVSKAIHPRFTLATLSMVPGTGTKLIQRDGGDLLTGVAAAKLAVRPKDQWTFALNFIDYMDGLAIMEEIDNQTTSYIQLAWLDGEWKMINALRIMN